MPPPWPLQFEYGLAGSAGESRKTLAKKGAHAPCYVGLAKEGFSRIGVMPDKVLKALDLFAKRVVDRLGVELTRVSDRLQHLQFPFAKSFGVCKNVTGTAAPRQ